MENILENNLEVVGNNNNIPLKLTANVSVTLISGIDMVLSANRKYWLNGILTYEITLTNNSAYNYNNLVLTDTLDISLISFVNNSLKINDEVYSNYTYDENTGLLTINLDDLNVNTIKKITFDTIRK